ncbi:hypothetical protein Cob_v009127 [Colletotrichum orbiculare MAFF 240422]|uniref:Uncharacterized protein n=1 Tax=Colletotrichum orbiculare (strain 104-T / ATCC 96160 / CBS 514.97 / LARS 414 / MAFF 240422) TaxID=1213857 RepID=A0A484FJE2_COLOR|nr:hypothetical protein Cob_v009127 [Colletotrichum orbiculare MAFF 240422]
MSEIKATTTYGEQSTAKSSVAYAELLNSQAEVEVTKRANQIRDRLAIPSRYAKGIIQHRAGEIRNKMVLPENEDFDDMEVDLIRHPDDHHDDRDLDHESQFDGPESPCAVTATEIETPLPALSSQQSSQPQASQSTPSRPPKQYPAQPVTSSTAQRRSRARSYTGTKRQASVAKVHTPSRQKQQEHRPNNPVTPSMRQRPLGNLGLVSSGDAAVTGNTTIAMPSTVPPTLPSTLPAARLGYGPGPVFASSFGHTVLRNPSLINDSMTNSAHNLARMGNKDTWPGEKVFLDVYSNLVKARQLAKQGYAGPFKAGIYLCLIDSKTGLPENIGILRFDAVATEKVRDIAIEAAKSDSDIDPLGIGHNVITAHHLGNNRDLSSFLPTSSGTPIWSESQPSFRGFQETRVAGHVVGAG